MRWNSVFDPDATAGGHQPLYRDTFAAIYDHYAVISADAVVKFCNVGTTSYFVGILTDDDVTPSTAIDTLCEQTTGQHVILPPQTGSLSTHVFNKHWDCKSVLGIDPYTSQTYKTAVGSDPSEQSDLIAWCADATGATNTSIFYDITVTYLVLWTELATPTQS
jgi:hypothetical protein